MPSQYYNTSSSPHKAAQTHRPITVCVEGNIGSGKTTLLNHLATREGIAVFQEPVDKWRNVRGKNLLDLMYQDPCRWSHLFQTYVQLTMMQLHMQPCSAAVKVMERSIYSARHCFVENLYQTGKISEPEYNVYCEWFKMVTSNLDINVDLIVYLCAEPELVKQRILERGRSEEASIPLSYLEQLHSLHQTWLSADDLPAPLLVFSKDMSLQQMCSSIEEHLAVIQQERLLSFSSSSSVVQSALPSLLLSDMAPEIPLVANLPKTAAATN